MVSSTTNDELVRNATAINNLILTHGVQCAVGFDWQDTFIHVPFADPQYGAFPVDPVQQYGDAYLQSVFVTDPTIALNAARQQLRDAAAQDLTTYCAQHRIERGDLVAIIDAVGVRVPESDDVLSTLTDDQVATVWAVVDTNPIFQLARE
jgi:hypothetical protein